MEMDFQLGKRLHELVRYSVGLALSKDNSNRSCKLHDEGGKFSE